MEPTLGVKKTTLGVIKNEMFFCFGVQLLIAK